MQTLKVGEAQMEYQESGHGQISLLLVHGALVSDAFEPLASEMAQTSPDKYRIVNFHRRGYGESSEAIPPFSIEDQARDCLALLDSLNIEKAHVVGHSMSGLIALQLAVDSPGRIRSLSLIEPSLIVAVPSAAQGAQALSKVGELYQAGDKMGALDYFLRGTGGDAYMSMGRFLPHGWLEDAAKNVDLFFKVELPSIRTWKLDANESVKQPILSVYGTQKRWGGVSATGAEFDQVMRSWFPQRESLPIPGAYHWPHLTNTAEFARALSDFVRKTD